MKFTIEEEKLGAYIYVNGEEDGRESLGTQEVEYEVSDALYNECVKEFEMNNGNFDEEEFLKEYGEFLANKGHKVRE
nr:MAG TPA: hypothetical protein [Caudoviricetes sp.]